MFLFEYLDLYLASNFEYHLCISNQLLIKNNFLTEDNMYCAIKYTITDLIDLSKIEGFEWDKGNSVKNKHKVEKDECESIFFNLPLIIFNDDEHSIQKEKRYGALGITNEQRKLAIYFTVRNNKIRIISARNQGKKEKEFYIKQEK